LKKFDVVVVGAGTGGCLAAKTVAEADFQVCIIDRKKEGDIGDKVCGDAIGKHHFDDLGLEYPTGEELEQRIVGAKLYSPDMETVFEVKGEGLHGFIINRLQFGQRLLKNAVDAGATLMDSTQAVDPIIKNGSVVGVLVNDLETRKKETLHSQVVVDASGFSAVLRKKLSPEIGIDTAVDDEDVTICYREIRELEEYADEPDYIRLYLSQKWAPGGYTWFFPEGGKKVNVGVGVTMFSGFPNPKNQLYDNLLSMPLFKGSSVMKAGTWYDPARRTLDCMTGNGIVTVGDAACQVNPIHGGGMGPSMMGGFTAGKAIIEAMEREDVSREGLWSYNIKYMQSYGASQASLDVFRLFFHGIGDDDLNYGMRHHLITEEDILKATMNGEIHLNITEASLRVFRGLGKLSLLKNLRDVANLMKKVREHYWNYPTSPQGFEEWRNRTQALIGEANKWRKSKK
jgi:geranylgeranyl reductase family protein